MEGESAARCVSWESGVEAQGLAVPARRFEFVLKEAQNILRFTFDMELVEMPTRAAAHDTTAGQGPRHEPGQSGNSEWRAHG